MIFKLNRIKKI